MSPGHLGISGRLRSFAAYRARPWKGARDGKSSPLHPPAAYHHHQLRRLARVGRIVLSGLVLACLTAPLLGQAGGSGGPATKPSDAAITFSFPENVELKVLVDYVSQRLGLNILYDEQIQGKRVTIKAPAKISKEALLSIVGSALRMKGLALVDGDLPGWKRIIAASSLVANAPGFPETPTPGSVGGAAGITSGDNTPVTQVFTLRYTDPQRLDQLIRPFLTQPGANSIVLAEQRALIITDFSLNLQRIDELVKMIDQPRRDTAFEFVRVEHVDVAQLAPQVMQLLNAKNRGGSATQDTVEISQDPRTNQLILIGSKERVADALSLVKALDVDLDLETRVYQLKAVTPERMERLARELIGPVDAKRVFRVATDREANLLVVTTTPEIHKRIEALRANLDSAAVEEQSPVRFYKLLNSTAAEVLATIKTLESSEGFKSVAIEGTPAPGSSGSSSGIPGNAHGGNSASGGWGIHGIETIAGGNRLPGAPGAPPPEPPIYKSTTPTATQPASGSTLSGGSGNSLFADDYSGLAGGRQTIKTRRATVTSDVNTNSIIVVADPAVQAVYARLIKMLDRRRPQVLLECTIVTLDVSGGYSLGVEISKSGAFDNSQTLSFSSFGLSTVDKNTGRLTLTPGLGFNGAVISANIADIVIRALATSGRAKVMSAPKILVNDNATGTLASIDESPFTSVNASSTVATTSFAGYVSAGTTISLTPHISAGDHLALEYSVALNSFSGTGSAGIPPPRQSNTVQSQVTIPDGSTIIVGGLSRDESSHTVSALPFLGEIPLLGYLFSNHNVSEKNGAMFVFVRPVILRDDQFEDLKYLSSKDLAAAGLNAQDLPVSDPMEIQ